MKIYYVEDDKNIRELVVYTLKNSGFEAEGFECGRDFFARLEESLPHLVILDIMLPDQNGNDILKSLRSGAATRDIPVIMLTALGSEYDKVMALDGGADDYIQKPFGIVELISRTKALLRRTYRESGTSVSIGKLTLDEASHRAAVGEQELTLTLKEFELLLFLCKNRGRVMTRDAILQSVWGYDFDGETRTVDVHMLSLRKKLGETQEIIETVRGVGYVIR